MMSDHVRTQLRDAVVAALRGNVAGVAERVFPGRTWPLSVDTDFPAILVFTPGGPSSYDTMGWGSATAPMLVRQERVSAEVRVRTRAGGSASDPTSGPRVEPDKALDDIALEVERLVFQWAVGAALVQTLELVNTQIETRVVGDAREGLLLLTWRAEIRTPAEAPDTAI